MYLNVKTWYRWAVATRKFKKLVEIKVKTKRLKNLVKVNKFLREKWTKALDKHIFEGDFDKNWVISWVHYKSGIKSWKVEIVWNQRPLWNWFYEAKIKWFNQELYNKQKSDYETFMNGPKPSQWKTYTWPWPDQWWWKEKKDASTFFPDHWSKEKVKQEIAEAYRNIEKTEDIVERSTGRKKWKKHIWISSSW